MKNTQADGPYCKVRTFCKKRKNKLERRKAKYNPTFQPTYGKYKGWCS